MGPGAGSSLFRRVRISTACLALSVRLHPPWEQKPREPACGALEAWPCFLQGPHPPGYFQAPDLWLFSYLCLLTAPSHPPGPCVSGLSQAPNQYLLNTSGNGFPFLLPFPLPNCLTRIGRTVPWYLDVVLWSEVIILSICALGVEAAAAKNPRANGSLPASSSIPPLMGKSKIAASG